MSISPQQPAHVHGQILWNSLALPSGRILPREGSPPLPDIPLTRIGLTDTLKVRLDGPVCQRDQDRLLSTGEFTSKKSRVREAASSNGPVKQLGSQTFLCRKRDGLRITSFGNCAFVEFSSPRVLGLYSDEQHLMSEQDVRRAVDLGTSELLPWSTALARAARKGEPWSIHRQDFAINLDGSIDEVNEALRKSKHFLARTSRSTVFDGAGIGWYGGDYDVIVYDPSVRPPRGRLRSSLQHQSFRPDGGRRLRIETRLKNPRSVARFAALLEVNGHGLPYSVSCGPKNNRNLRLLLDHDLCHRFLARAVAGLRGSGSAKADAAAYKSFGTYAQRMLLALHPEFWSVAEDRLSPEVLRDLRKDVTAISLEHRGLDLLHAAWSRRRFSPRTLWLEQDRRERLALALDAPVEPIPVSERTLQVLRMLNAHAPSRSTTGIPTGDAGTNAVTKSKSQSPVELRRAKARLALSRLKRNIPDQMASV